VLGAQAFGDGGADEEDIDAVEQGGGDRRGGGVIEEGGWDGEDPVEVEADLGGRAPAQLVSPDDAAPAGSALAQGEGGQEDGGGSLEGEDTAALSGRRSRVVRCVPRPVSGRVGPG